MGDGAAHPGGAVQELADLVEAYGALVVVPADRTPFLQHSGQGGIGAPQCIEIWPAQLDNPSGERRTAGGKRLEQAGRPLGTTEVPVGHALAPAAVVKPQLVRAPLAQRERGFLVT